MPILVGLGERAARLIERGWCQGTLALDADGVAVWYWDRRAVRWCAAGALGRADIHGWQNRAVIEVLLKKTGTLTLGEYNDTPGRTQAEVAALLRTLPPEEFP